MDCCFVAIHESFLQLTPKKIPVIIPFFPVTRFDIYLFSFAVYSKQRTRGKEKKMEHIIEVEHLQKSYGNVKAVKDVSFYVEPGKLFAFLGPNGAGKSTTINSI